MNNKETLKGLIIRGSLNTRQQTKGYSRMHPVSMRFLQMALQKLSSSTDCLWRDDVHDLPTYFDIGGPLGLLCEHMEKDCMSEYKTGAMNAFTPGELTAASQGHLFVGMRHQSPDKLLLHAPKPNHRYNIRNYNVRDREKQDFLKGGY